MSIIDRIKEILNLNKKNAQIYAETLQKTYGEKQPLEIGLYDGKTPLSDTELTILINGVKYNRKTDKNGIATLNINLPHGEYQAIITFENTEYNKVKTYCDVKIRPKQQITRMEGTDIQMTVNDGTKYQCAVYDENNNRVKGEVDILINGVTYRKTAEQDGLYKLSINLNQGTYPIKSTFIETDLYKTSTVNNTITVNPKPQPKPVYTLNPYFTQQGGGKLGQINGYSCGVHSLMQCIYRLTGVELSESTLMSVCGTTTSGTSHSGLETGLAWFNRNYGYNLKMQWKNFSEVGYSKLQEYINNGAVFMHILYRNQWGHYEVPKQVSGSNIIVLNSLGSYCNYPAYCGYIETRSQSTQTSYVNGISQKGVCIITRE